LKLKQGRKSWMNDQVQALEWAEKAFEKMDPHAKDDIKKFQEKLEKIDKDLDKHNKLMLASNIDYYSIREEFN